MIGVDTKVVIRFLTHDDDTQFNKAYRTFKEHELFIPDTVILETEWVLRYAYGFEPSEIGVAFTRLFGLPNIHLSNPVFIAQAIEWHQQGLDFADALHLAQCQQHRQLVTFDRNFINKAKDLCKCSVVEP